MSPPSAHVSTTPRSYMGGRRIRYYLLLWAPFTPGLRLRSHARVSYWCKCLQCGACRGWGGWRRRTPSLSVLPTISHKSEHNTFPRTLIPTPIPGRQRPSTSTPSCTSVPFPQRLTRRRTLTPRKRRSITRFWYVFVGLCEPQSLKNNVGVF